MAEKKHSVLLEMRPALDGYAGIPQETRLLFRGLCMMNSVAVEGLLQTSLRFLATGMPDARRSINTTSVLESTRLNRYSRVVVSLDSKPSKAPLEVAKLYMKRRREAFVLTCATLLRPSAHKIRTTVFEPQGFEAFIWQAMFAKTLPAADFALVTGKNYRLCTIPWNIMQSAGLNSLKFIKKVTYPRIDTQGVNVFIAQTPYPGRVDAGTALVIRYHDALPIFMPHAFANKARHQATHFNALLSNVHSGAYFSCVSEATRQDLLKIFPEVATRSVTIHNMVSPHFFFEDSSPARVSDIVRSRLNLQSVDTYPNFRSLNEQDSFYRQHLGTGSCLGTGEVAANPEARPLRYLLMVSTVEPRKNHLALVAAWQAVRVELDPHIKLVFVGGLGWDVEPILRGMRSWIDQGGIFILNAVPADELRVLYRHALATVCPSLAEGFDFSGVEAMRCGSMAIASDISVHREIYDDAAEYFDPYDVSSLTGALKRTLYSAQADDLRSSLIAKGKLVSSRYLPEVILPKWEVFLNEVSLCTKSKPA